MITNELPKREIKFRAWDKKRKIMVGSDYPDNWEGVNDEYYDEWVMLELTLIESVSKNENFVLMQYTGLKDKEGKDIYEGDIIMYNMSWQNPKTKVKAIVPYMLEPVYGELPFHWFSELQSDAKSIEVIGNIFENPELIDN